MGVVQFVFHVLKLLLIVFTQRNLCCISKSTMKHQQYSEIGLTMIVVIIGSGCLLIAPFKTYELSIVFTIECGKVNKYEDILQSLIN